METIFHALSDVIAVSMKVVVVIGAVAVATTAAVIAVVIAGLLSMLGPSRRSMT